METIKRPEIRPQGLAVPEQKEITPDSQYQAGLFLLIINLGIFLASDKSTKETGVLFTQGISVLYVVILFSSMKMKVFWRSTAIPAFSGRNKG